MERLLHLCSTDLTSYKSIVEEKLSIERAMSTEWSGIEYLLSRHGYEGNEYLQREQIKYYRDFVSNFVLYRLSKKTEVLENF